MNLVETVKSVFLNKTVVLYSVTGPVLQIQSARARGKVNDIEYLSDTKEWLFKIGNETYTVDMIRSNIEFIQ